MTKQDTHNLSRTELSQLLRKYWPVVLTVFVSGTVGMYLVLNVFFTDVYESTTRILVKVGRENVETPATVSNGQLFSQGVRVADINSEVQILSSRELIDRVVDRLGPDRFRNVLVPPSNWQGYPKYLMKLTARNVKNGYREFLIAAGLDKRLDVRETAILALVDGVKVEPVRESDILMLKVRTPSAKLCLDVSNALLEEYMKKRAVARRSPAGRQLFEERVADVKRRLAELQQARSGIRSRWNLTSPEEQRSLYLKQLNTIETEIVQNSAEIERFEKQRELMASRIPEMPELEKKEETIATNPSIQSIKDRITTLRMERSKVGSRYQPTSEVIKKMDTEIADLEGALAKENATILNSVVSESNQMRRRFTNNIDEDIVFSGGLKQRNKYLQEPASELTKRMREIDRGLDNLTPTEREYKRAEQEYLAYAKRFEEARLSEELDDLRVANVAVIGSPETPLKPVYPRKLFLMGIAMPVSLLLGVALCALLETTEDRITDEESALGLSDLDYLGTVDLGELAAASYGSKNGHNTAVALES